MLARDGHARDRRAGATAERRVGGQQRRVAGDGDEARAAALALAGVVHDAEPADGEIGAVGAGDERPSEAVLLDAPGRVRARAGQAAAERGLQADRGAQAARRRDPQDVQPRQPGDGRLEHGLPVQQRAAVGRGEHRRRPVGRTEAAERDRARRPERRVRPAGRREALQMPVAGDVDRPVAVEHRPVAAVGDRQRRPAVKRRVGRTVRGEARQLRHARVRAEHDDLSARSHDGRRAAGVQARGPVDLGDAEAGVQCAGGGQPDDDPAKAPGARLGAALADAAGDHDRAVRRERGSAAVTAARGLQLEIGDAAGAEARVQRAVRRQPDDREARQAEARRGRSRADGEQPAVGPAQQLLRPGEGERLGDAGDAAAAERRIQRAVGAQLSGGQSRRACGGEHDRAATRERDGGAGAARVDV